MEDRYIVKNGKKLRYGYTTGSCAAAAAKAAAIMLFEKTSIEEVELMTPKGILLHLLLQDTKIENNQVTTAVEKDGGDDPDVTTGLLIYATVEKTGAQPIGTGRKEAQDTEEQNPGQQVTIHGGIGVGRVTKPGLNQPVGNAAINQIPREMIQREVRAICENYQYTGGIRVTISVPGGKETAEKTFNPRLGITGGISILGTSGIVEPMSEQALLDTIRLELTVKRETGQETLLLAPGNYGVHYLDSELGIHIDEAVKYSNYVGETMDLAAELGFTKVLLVSHIGKLIKVAGGIMNTHSKNADARMEILAANAILEGAGADLAKKILEAVTTDEAVKQLQHAGILQQVMERIMGKVRYYLEHRVYNRMQIGAIAFSGAYKELGRTENATEMLSGYKSENSGKRG